MRSSLRIADTSIPESERNFRNYYQGLLYAVHGLSEFLLKQIELVMHEGVEPSFHFFVGCSALERSDEYMNDLEGYIEHLEKRVSQLQAEKQALEGKIGSQCQVIPEITTSGGSPLHSVETT